ncbi:MAG TPA: molybdenum cofactor guanylyltransferase [Candidatus Binataceae bacterium]|jgi:molybdopterin-guanine dinucleotide biosynthesis protein A
MKSVKSASAVILAGGRSARMGGRPKATLLFDGVTLIERIAAELGRAFDDIVIVAAPAAEAIELPALGGARIVRDDRAFEGPAGALARGLRAARHNLAFACSCDLPMLRAETAASLLSLIGEHDDAVIPEVGGRLQPLHAVYRRRCAGALDAMLARGERRLGAVAKAANCRIVAEAEYRHADPDALSCFNINTPADYARALGFGGAKSPPR